MDPIWWFNIQQDYNQSCFKNTVQYQEFESTFNFHFSKLKVFVHLFIYWKKKKVNFSIYMYKNILHVSFPLASSYLMLQWLNLEEFRVL